MKKSGLALFGACLLLTCLVLAGCGKPGAVPTQGPEKSDTQYSALIKLGAERMGLHDYSGASDAYKAATQLAATPAQKAESGLGLAEAAMASGNTDGAAKALETVDRQYLTPARRVDVQILQGEVDLSSGSPDAAAARLRMVMYRSATPLSRDQARKGIDLLGQALMRTGRYDEAAKAYIDTAAKYGLDDERMQKSVAAAVAKLPVPRGEALAASVTDPAIKVGTLAGLAKAQLNQGQLNEAKTTIGVTMAMPQAAPLKDYLNQLAEDVAQARLVDPRAVGVILPLSGPYAAAGSEVLAAIEMGLGVFSPGGGVTLYIEDSKGDPRAAAQAVEKLATQDRVVAVIGPLRASASLAAARQASALSVPLISLSRVDGVTDAGPCVFQNFFTPEEQVDAVLDEMLDRRKQKFMAILAPDNSYGKGFVKLMERRLAERGGVVVRSVLYNPEQTDFSSQIRQLVKLPAGDYRPGMPDAPEPILDFEVLFLPDGAARLGMLAPQLAYYDVVGVDLAGTSLWYDEALLQNSGKYLEGGYFPVAFDPADKRPQVRAFVAEYSQNIGRQPNLLDAHGYDAAMMVRSIIQGDDPPRTRNSFCARLGAMDSFEGVCGVAKAGPDGRLRKQLELFTVRRGRFVRLSDEQGQAQPTPAGARSENAAQGTEAARAAAPSEAPARRENPGGDSGLRVTPLDDSQAPPAPASTIAH